MTDLYNHKYFTASRKFQYEPERIEAFIKQIMSHHPETVLDVGCGLATLVKELRNRGVRAFGVDSAKALMDFWPDVPWLEIAPATKLPFPDKSIDVVVSSDFFEHIPEEDIDAVYAEMQRVAEGPVLACIAYEAKLTRKQALYHCTNKPKSWWKDKLPGVTFMEREI